ncbi:MAG: hypothetical protein HZA53_10930 [Planctomycetes bacterium]|nr:hypothetical protein [Planctomycetota bacterium]
MHRILLSLALFTSCAAPMGERALRPDARSLASAESAPLAYQEPKAPAPSGADASGADKSGTNPAVFLRTLAVGNEYDALRGSSYADLTTIKYIHPFADNRMNLRTKLPFAVSDAAGGTDSGLGDISVRWNWIADVTLTDAWLVGFDLMLDTASEDVLGRGKNIGAPVVTRAWFLNATTIFAPTLQENVGFGGDSARADVNETLIDLYFVKTAADKKSWLTVDPTVVLDWENDAVPVTLEVEYGWNLGGAFGGALNAFVRPGIGIGSDRPFDWNLEAGVNVIGF